MQFAGAETAVRWAESRLARSQIKSQMSGLQKQGLRGYDDLSASELDDIAQTITHIAQNIQPPKGTSLLAVYGQDTPSRDWNLADVMVLHAKHFEFDGVRFLTPEQLKSMMLIIIRDERLMANGQRMVPKTQIYAICNLNKEKYKKWHIADLRRLGQAMLRDWIDAAARQLENDLNAIDLLSR